MDSFISSQDYCVRGKEVNITMFRGKFKLIKILGCDKFKSNQWSEFEFFNSVFGILVYQCFSFLFISLLTLMLYCVVSLNLVGISLRVLMFIFEANKRKFQFACSGNSNSEC